MLFGQEHVVRYRETDGQEGHDWHGTTVLLLTTTGSRTGKPRTVPLLYVRDGPRIIVAGSNWGQRDHPAWSTNLLVDPRARVQIGPDRMECLARAASLEERERLEKSATNRNPNRRFAMRFAVRFIAALVVLGGSLGSLAAADWPAFRGSQGGFTDDRARTRSGESLARASNSQGR